MGKPTHFQGQTIPITVKPPFFADFRVLNQLVPKGKPAHFKGQTNPRADKPLFFADCRVVYRFLVIRITACFLTKIFMHVR
ncbi:hypothetical protein H5410_042223 [Solanum commersonii]|uniref:Uncharacterized protein n=1 Tax=Solanum commersonii TaxID=4109 RepID=A0A9J5XV46_SOLCO|nr:hypothetical protein H5410_042223 [Solanum commersonii]